MTKKLNRAPMELDLDKFLQLHSSSDDDDDLNALPHRTVDEILNDTDSSSSSSPPSPSSSPSFNLKPFSNEALNSISKQDTISISTPQTPSPETVKLEPEVVESKKKNWFNSRNSGESSSNSNSYSIRRSTPHQLPQYLGGVRVNPKPGAALAAAAASSRSIPTPYAAAIRSRRANSDTSSLLRIRENEDNASSSGGDVVSISTSVDSDIPQLDSKDEEVVVHDVVDEVNNRTQDLPELNNASNVQEVLQEEVDVDEVNNRRENLPEFNNESNIQEYLQEEADVDEVNKRSENLPEFNSESNVQEVLQEEGEVVKLDEVEENSHSTKSLESMDQQTTLSSVDSVDKSSNVVSMESEKAQEIDLDTVPANELDIKTSEDSVIRELDVSDTEKNIIDDVTPTQDDTNSTKNGIAEDVEDRIVQSESQKGGKKSGKKLHSTMKPLELAEEVEKNHAYSGLHWEEGAAAQPMRLEGIRRGPPAVGYLDIDATNVVTRTISSQAFRRDHGSPQVLSVHANFIAVGMSKGLILVVPSKYSPQNADNMDAKMLLLAPQGDKSHSPVTSMCFNQQGDLLLVGYGNGHIIVWDVQKASIAREITGEHTAPVVHTLFLGQNSQVNRQFKVVTGDCKGLVLLHTFTPSVVPFMPRFTIKSQCLLDGQKTGIVLSASPLLIEDSASSTASPSNVSSSSSGIGSMMGGVVGGSLFGEGSSLVEEGVVIFGTYQTALVVRLSPNLEVYAQLSKPDGVRDGSMPHTAWKCTPQSQGETLDKVSLLAIAWDRKVQVAELVKSKLKVCKEWTLDSAAIGVAWLDDQMLVIVTMRRQFCLFSKDGNELHRTSVPIDVPGMDDFIVYHTYFSNVFGNPEKAYHNCLAVRGATIYILGPMHLLVSRLLPWKERIQVLRKAGDWMGALDMAMRLYDGHAHGVIDLPRTLDSIREAIMSYLVDLILSYVDESFSYISVVFCNQIGREEQEQNTENKRSSVHSKMEDQFARVGGVAVEFCVHIKRIDILFDQIFSKFMAVQHGGTFLELLEPYILKDMLGCLPPEIMQALVEHYSSKGWLQRVEQCVLHMDISSLDFNQVVRLCREHGLYGALIYLFNKGLDDFKAPLEELLLVLQNGQSKDSAAIGYRMLVYLKYCFSGLAFPPGHGVLPVSRLPSVRKELLQFLLEDSNGKEVTASLKFCSGVCPNLFHLLWLDTEATLEVLNFAFPEDSNSDSELTDLNLEGDKEDCKNTEDSDLLAQNVVNTLLPILDRGISGEDKISATSDLESKETWPSKKDVRHILEFIASFVACKRATISTCILKHILEFLTSENTSSPPSQQLEPYKRRQTQVLTLLRVVPETDWNSSYVLHLCEKAQYYQVCGYIHAKRRQYVAALESYMKDLDEPIHTFSFINSMLLQLEDTESVTFRSAVISRFHELVNLSREGAFVLIFDHFSTESEHILFQLRSYPKSLFLYLKTVIEVHLSGILNFSSFEKGYLVDPQIGSKLQDQSNEIKLYLERISDFPKLVRQNPVHMTDEMIELYLELLCQYEHNAVLKFLQTFENYRLEQCLRLCQEYKVIDAAAFLLERVGDVGSALLLTLSGLNDKFRILDSAVENIISGISSSRSSEMQVFDNVLRLEEVTVVCDTLHSAIGICQRNSKRLDPQESEFLWFQLLDSFCEPLRDPCDDKIVSRGDIFGTLAETFEVKEVKEGSVDYWRIPKSHRGAHVLRKLFAQFIKEIVEGMIGGYVHLPAIMSKLLSDNGSQVFGDFKLIILGMLGTYGFEKRILDTAKSLIEDDTFYTMSLLKKGASHGYAPQNLLCHICSCPLTKESSASGIRVFSCGHTTHIHCEISGSGSSNEHSSGCPVCVPKKKSKGYRSQSVFNDNRLVQNSMSRAQQTQVNNLQHLHESDLVEKPYGAQQISRFEMLSSLKKSQRSLQIESLPQLRLAPPAVYHEKIQSLPQLKLTPSAVHHENMQKGTNYFSGENSSMSIKSGRVSRQPSDSKMKKKPLRLPMKSSIFGTNKR